MPLRGLHLLVVEDDSDLREILVDALRKRGASIDEAAGGYEAIAMLGKTRYDFVLSDLRMPDGDGLCLARALVALPFPRPPIALHSGCDDIGEEECGRLGIVRVLQKPAPVTEIVACVRSACGRSP